MTDTTSPSFYDVVILGAGYAGLMAALGLAGRNSLSRVALVSESDAFVERIRLQEAIAGLVAPRLPPLSALFAKSKVTFLRGRVRALDPVNRRVDVDADGDTIEIGFTRCIYALGSLIDAATVRGVAEHAYRLDRGDGARSVAALRARLAASAGQAVRVTVVGGANTATEAAGEIKSTWPSAEVTIVSRSRVGDFKKGPDLERMVRAELAELGIRLIDGQTVTEVRAHDVVTAWGETITTDICVWAGGLRAPAIAREAGLAVDERNRIRVGPTLGSISHPFIIAVGDAVRPLAPTGASHRMSAFAAIITGSYAAKRILDEAKGRRPRPLSFSAYGQGVAIGRSGVGFFTFPNDGRAYFILRGPVALRVRNLFVWFLVFFLRLERKYPGLALFWIGRRRVSWQAAVEAMRSLPGVGERAVVVDVTSG